MSWRFGGRGSTIERGTAAPKGKNGVSRR